uniref:Ycf34 n=1 Tax=Alsidium seaforthii TaxID=2007182 RepID=A0A1Z1MDP6_9FLOR|nr:hypothetical protein [Bryothamnion seaforthii]ARW63911.1 hypothetical protein [Bryothamnion seaforthii]
MCICINCRHIHRCLTYSFIEKQHQKVRKQKNNKFIPYHTVININIYYKSSQIYLDWDLVECLSFAEQPGNWLVNIE